MKLKKVIDTLEGLDASLQALYVEREDKKFHLDLEDDDAEPLRRAKEHEVGLRKVAERDLERAKQRVTELESKVGDLEESAGKSVQDLRKTLETSFQQKVDKLTQDHEKEKATLEKSIKKVYVDNVAERIANEISDSPEILLPHLRSRLSVEIVDGEPVTRVTDAAGKASALSPDDLRDEYFTNAKFAPIMRATKGSGSGASNSGGRGGASKKFSALTEKERLELFRGNRPEYDRLKAEHDASPPDAKK